MRSGSLSRRTGIPAIVIIMVAYTLVGTFTSPLLSQEKEPNPDLNLRIDAEAEGLRPGNEFDAAILLDSAIDGIDGWQFGVAHDPAVVEVIDVRLGATTRVANNGEPPEFVVIDEAPEGGAGVTMGAVLSIVPDVTLDAGSDYELLKLRYRVVGNPDVADPCAPIPSTIEFTEALGAPARITVRVSVLGQSNLPILSGAAVLVRCAGTLEILRCEGGTDFVELEWDFPQDPGWDFLFLYRDGELLEMLDKDAKAFSDTGVAPGEHSYTVVTFVVEAPGGDVTLIFAKCRTVVNPVTLAALDPAQGSWIGGDELTVTGTAFDIPQDLRFVLFGVEGSPTEGKSLVLATVTIDSPTQATVRTPEASTLGRYNLRAETEFGDVELIDVFEVGFIRGEVNSDGVLDISDPVHIFEYVFVGTAEIPRCLDSADANDDGVLDISDPVLLLDHLFVGDLRPSAPFPAAGSDPTADDPLGYI